MNPVKDPHAHKRFDMNATGRRRRNPCASKAEVLQVDASMGQIVKESLAKLSVSPNALPAIVIGAEFEAKKLTEDTNTWLMEAQHKAWPNISLRWATMSPVGFSNPSGLLCHISSTFQIVAALVFNGMSEFDYNLPTKRKLQLLLRFYTQGMVISNDTLAGIVHEFVPKQYLKMQQDASESFER